ncbi:MAG: FAD-dependent oxidoreductase [Sporichthyaceae bacterium]|nr:FAD-dependent oxidoreductase [Sporichthyaceae bacterium]
MRSIAVAGTGLAGLQVVTALRAGGYTGTITMVGAEPHRPYDRPPLSKAVLLGEADDSTLAADWDALDVELRLECRATGLRGGDARSGGVLDTELGEVEFDQLVLACGALPVTLPGTERYEHVRTLRTIDDAHRLRAAFRDRPRVVIVGAGWIGAEVATAAARAGCQVHVIEALPAPLAGALPDEIGQLTAAWYEQAGIELTLGTRVLAVDETSVVLSDGRVIGADLVVVGIGVRPATDWLSGSGLARDAAGAVLTDAQLRTTMPSVYAVGDCAAWHSRRYGIRLHVEHWDVALHAPSVVAANLLGAEQPYDPVPYFWSEQFGRMVQYAGHHPAGERIVFRGDPSAGAPTGAPAGADPDGWTVCWLAGDRLVAVLAVNRPRDLTQGRRVMFNDLQIDPDRLADPAVSIKDATS